MDNRIQDKREVRRGDRPPSGAVDHRWQAYQARSGTAALVSGSGRKRQDRQSQSLHGIRSGESPHEHQEHRPVTGNETGPSGRSASTGDVPGRPARSSGGKIPHRTGTRNGGDPGNARKNLIKTPLAGRAVPPPTLPPHPPKNPIPDAGHKSVIK